jgi:hypothetical protein
MKLKDRTKHQQSPCFKYLHYRLWDFSPTSHMSRQKESNEGREKNHHLHFNLGLLPLCAKSIFTTQTIRLEHWKKPWIRNWGHLGLLYADVCSRGFLYVPLGVGIRLV